MSLVGIVLEREALSRGLLCEALAGLVAVLPPAAGRAPHERSTVRQCLAFLMDSPGIDSSLGIDPSLGINSSLVIDSSPGIDSSKESIPGTWIPYENCQKESQFTIPKFEELADL